MPARAQHRRESVEGLGVTAPSRARSTPRGRAELAYFGLIGFILVLYANPGHWVTGLEEVGFAKIAATIALVALGGSWLLYDRPLRLGGTTGVCITLFFVWIGASAAWSFYRSMTLAAFTDGLKYLAIFFVVANVVDSEARYRSVVAWLAWSSAIPAIGCIVSFSQGEHLVEGDRAAWIGSFANPNDLAYYLTVGLAMTLAAREGASTALRRCAYLVLLGLLAFTIVLTKSRGGMLASTAVVLLWSLRSFRRARALVGVLVTLLCVVSIGPGGPGGSFNVFRARNESAIAFGEDVSARGRVDAWRTGMNIAAERPLVGVGAGAFLVAWPSFAPGDAGPPRTAHNTWVQILSELGLPGLGLFIGALVAAMIGLSRRVGPGLKPQLRGVQVGLLGFAACSMTGGLAFSWPVYLLLGLAVAAERLRSRSGALQGAQAPAPGAR